MATVLDEYLDGSVDNDDVFPCKGCGDILEEGKAFELAGNRWHLDCFRCNTCGTLLDSDANLLLLGDGSLICNNCTYSCSACGNKIEDLAILTGDQAFCSTCFRCRNCKRKIENLRYARTSQGIFCMQCHESLMARRRKKSKAAAAAKARDQEHSPMVKEKSLPALPPSAIPPNAFSNDRVDPDSDTPVEASPKPRPDHARTESSSRGNSRPPMSPERRLDSSSRSEGLGLPPQAYRKNRNSAMLMSNDSNDNESGDGFFISVALDPSPAAGATPRSMSDNVVDPNKRKDYFGSGKPGASEKRSDSHSSTPHIAFQEKGRQASSDYDSAPSSRKLSLATSPPDQSRSPAVNEKLQRSTPSRSKPSNDDFKLQEAPRPKQLVESRSSSVSSSTPQDTSAAKAANGVRKENLSLFPHSDARHANDSNAEAMIVEEDDGRDSSDSLSRVSSRPEKVRAITRKELPSTASRNGNGQPGPPGRAASSEESVPTTQQGPGRASEQKKTIDNYMAPRSAPIPPSSQSHPAGKESVSSVDDQASPKVSPKLPRWSNGGEFSLDEDMARILGTDERSSSLLRRVSNVARHGRPGSIDSSAGQSRANHGRSLSETTRATASPRWPKNSVAEERAGHHPNIGSPNSVTSTGDTVILRRQLRNSEQRVAELERQFNTESDIKTLNKRLIEKRKTVSVLDTQTEIMIKQLEVLAGYVERAKESKSPLDVRDLEDSAIKDLVQKLENVKLGMSEGIELLHEERDQLLEEKKQAMADRDRALMEFATLSSKNAQLADMNNDLTQQIQERFKAQMAEGKSTNGLGIYTHHKGAGSSINLDNASMSGTATLVAADEDPIMEAGPTLVQVRKGQVKKFNWKKGSKTMAQNVAKGVNRAVVAFQNERDTRPQQGIAIESIGMPYTTTVAPVESPAVTPGAYIYPTRQQQAEQGRQAFGFFGKKNAMPKSTSAPAVVPDVVEPPSVLFGSDLVARAEYERRQIPNIVSRCIEEVELRGMDQEGIYRKNGGNSQVNMIKDGFDKSENYDLSDPDLDIMAVTSVLKQYFRKLPTPLLTYDVYDRVLESTAIGDETERCNHLRNTFGSMPLKHRDCLEFLMFHLDRVAQRDSENLMTTKNLAVVFAPTIMRDPDIEREMSDMHAKNLAVQFILEKSKVIFDDEA